MSAGVVGVTVDFAPVWVASLARLGVLVAMALFVGRAIVHTRHRRSTPTWVNLGAVALFLFMARGAFLQLDRFRQPMQIEELPVTAIATVIAWLALLRFERDRDLR